MHRVALSVCLGQLFAVRSDHVTFVLAEGAGVTTPDGDRPLRYAPTFGVVKILDHGWRTSNEGWILHRTDSAFRIVQILIRSVIPHISAGIVACAWFLIVRIL